MKSSRGITLIELLVVIAIMILLVAVVLPKFQLNGEQARIREGSRLVSVFINSTRSRAWETGRPVGVLFERHPTNKKAVIALRQVEVPPYFAGSTMNNQVQLQLHQTSGQVRMRIQYEAFPDKMIRPGDKIRFGCQGQWYKIHAGSIPVDSDGYLQFSSLPDEQLRVEVYVIQYLMAERQKKIDEWKLAHPNEDVPTWILNYIPPPPPMPPPQQSDGWVDDPVWLVCEPVGWGSDMPWYTDTLGQIAPGWPMVSQWSSGISFGVAVFPQMTLTPPVLLPDGIAIDMTASGMGNKWLLGDDPVILMFDPAGNVSSLRWEDGPVKRDDVPSDPLFFLVGVLDHVPSFDPSDPNQIPFGQRHEFVGGEEDKPNWQRMDSRWVGVNPKMGSAMRAVNAKTPKYFEVVDPNSPKFDGSQSPERLGQLAIHGEARLYIRQAWGAPVR